MVSGGQELNKLLDSLKKRVDRADLPENPTVVSFRLVKDLLVVTEHAVDWELRALAAAQYECVPPQQISNGDFYTAEYRAAVLADSPVGYWRLGETSGNAVDLSGNGNDGTITGVVQGVAGLLSVEGDSDTAYRFDGASGDVDCQSLAVLDNIFDGGGSIEAWISADTDGENDAGTVASKVSGTGWYLWVGSESGGAMNLLLSVTFDGTDGQWRTTAKDIVVGTAHHIVVTYNADATTNDPIMYVDGVSVSVTEAATPTGTRDTDAAKNFMIGNVPADNQTFDGTIDEVAAYDADLTAAQVLSHYSAGASLPNWTEDIDAGITATTAWHSTQGEVFAEQGNLASLEVNVTASTGTGQASRKQTVTAAAAEVWNFEAYVQGTAYANATARLRIIWSGAATANDTSVDVTGGWDRLLLQNQVAPGGTTSVVVYLEIDVTTTGGTGRCRFGQARAEKVATTMSARANRIICGEWACRV